MKRMIIILMVIRQLRCDASSEKDITEDDENDKVDEDETDYFDNAKDVNVLSGSTPDCQRIYCSSPGFGPSIRQHNGF